ncbi:cytidylate kinase-like family protein [Ktedonosporobacter rubrisoli]|uniref:Cytidylate kinase-like family protein n=1 Tax=Ktedonosporobacter rubrisoli TaxID=2509675 RepID=A0A4P6K2P4_KTERU|nr:cytidylate kinase-like family protein [Ktedonosporobacter rubrisoli]QBD81756.1 cytidylate kinase-like family protein [Ktedonosporobacter rubrisoli]
MFFLPGREQSKNGQANEGGDTRLLPETMLANDPLPSGTPAEGSVVVTISRQFGSGGSDIGRLLAQQCGLNYVDHEIINEVARRLEVDVQHVARQDEQTVGMAGHILEALKANSPLTMNYGSFFNNSGVPQSQAQEAVYLHLTQKVILEAASRGNAVIIGRGSQFLLHNAPRTLHIHVFAPLPDRINYVMQEFQLSHAEANRLIEQRDYEHESYLLRYYGSDGQQPWLYHLLINTGLFSFELAASLIQQALPIVKEIQ